MNFHSPTTRTRRAPHGERRTVEADLGPVRYLATLIGQPDEAVLRWFILVAALLLDPAACCYWQRPGSIDGRSFGAAIATAAGSCRPAIAPL